MSTESGIPSAVRVVHSESCRPNVNALGVSMFMWGLLADFFKEMIIRVIITGINLMRTKSLSHTSLIIRARSISHEKSPTGEEKVRIISKKIVWAGPLRIRQDNLHYSYAPYPWLGKWTRWSARAELEHLCKLSHPRHGEQNHNNEMRRSHDREVYRRVPADHVENTRDIYPAVQRFEK